MASQHKHTPQAEVTYSNALPPANEASSGNTVAGSTGEDLSCVSHSPALSTRKDNPTSIDAPKPPPKASFTPKLSRKARGKLPAMDKDDKDDIISLPEATDLPQAVSQKESSCKARTRLPAMDKDQEELNDNKDDGNKPPVKYATLLRRLENRFESTQKTTYRKIIELLRSRNQFETRVQDIEVYVGGVNDNHNGKPSHGRSQSNGDPPSPEQINRQNRPSLTQRQNAYEDSQDRLGEQQDVTASQQLRFDRRLADIEHYLQLNTPTRSVSAPPRPAASTAGLFPPWSEGYWGGNKSPSRLAGAWGPRSSRSIRGTGVLPSIEGEIVVGGTRHLLGPPVTGRAAIPPPSISTVPVKRRSQELEDDDDEDTDQAKNEEKGTKKKRNNEEEEEEEGEEENREKDGQKPKPEPRLKLKVKPAGTTRSAPKEPKILLKINKRKLDEGDEGLEDDAGEPDSEPKSAKVAKSAIKVAPKPVSKKRRAEESEDEDDYDDERQQSKPTGTAKPARKKTKVAPKAPKIAPKAARKPAPRKRRADNADEEPDKKKAKVAPKEAKPAPKTAPKTKAAPKPGAKVTRTGLRSQRTPTAAPPRDDVSDGSDNGNGGTLRRS